MIGQMWFAKQSVCENRFEILVDPGMDSKDIEGWAHDRLNEWLQTRMDLTRSKGYDSGQKGPADV